MANNKEGKKTEKNRRRTMPGAFLDANTEPKPSAKDKASTLNLVSYSGKILGALIHRMFVYRTTGSWRNK